MRTGSGISGACFVLWRRGKCMHLTTANQSEIRRAHLVSVFIYRIEKQKRQVAKIYIITYNTL